MDRCFFCKGETKNKNIDVDFRWGEQLFIVKNVPVEVCTQCGERYYSSEVSKKLDELVKKQSSSRIKPQKVIEVPIFSWH